MMKEVVIAVLSLTSCICAKDQVRMTMMSINHFNSSADGEYRCYLSSPDTDAKVTSFRTVNTRNDPSKLHEPPNQNPDPPSAMYEGEDTYPFYKVSLSETDHNGWFGVFGCKATRDGRIETRISTTRMRSTADYVPVNGLFTQTVSVGDADARITMMSFTKKSSGDVRWRKDDGNVLAPRNFAYHINGPIQNTSAGVYECFFQGLRFEAQHGLNILLVRACRANRWGPPDCNGVCDSCYNGGICDENNGKCVCPPGFRGDNCLTACGGNKFGYECEIECLSNGGDDSCRDYLFCLVHPYGCRCNTGWKGLACDEACNASTFGASCLQSCNHCTSGKCDRYTGNCTGSDTSCKPGWTGDNCQECDGNYFGTDCTQECHCSKESCNRETGLCKPGGCLPQWVDLYPPYSCQTGLINITYTKMNSGIPVPVTCEAEEGPGGDLRSLRLILSKDAESREDGGITKGVRTEDFTTRNFTVTNVQPGDMLHCLLRVNGSTLAVLSQRVEMFTLPKFTSAPVSVSNNNTSVSISWLAWDETMDIGDPPLVNYVTYYKKSDKKKWIPGETISPQTLQYTFTSLDPDTSYSFRVSAVREGAGGEGPKSPELSVRTHCNVPSSPENVKTEISGRRQELVKVSWKIPSEGLSCSSGVIKFTVYYYSSESDLTSVDVPDPAASSFILEGLTPEVNYTIYVTVSTSGGESKKSNEVDQHVPIPTGPHPAAIAVPITLSFLVILLVIVGAVCFVQRRGKPQTPTSSYKQSGTTNNTDASDIHLAVSFTKNEELLEDEDDDADEVLYSNLEKPVSILLENLEKYMWNCENSRSANLEQQLMFLNGQQQFPSHVAHKEQNKPKNRFKNMVAYDHSRVVLNVENGDPHSDYYNANYIKNAENKVAYIASQGPNKASVDDFWRMVWKENVRNIVMLTNLFEDGKDRCTQYWPPAVGASKSFREIKVKWESEDQFGDYDMRELQVKLGEESRKVTNWHFKSWPDKSIPDQPTPLIEFARRIKTSQKRAAGHLLVHCSAGVGRTGTFIALSSLMDVVETETRIDIYGYVEQMRQDRVKLVQTGMQFKFLHECLLEIYLAGNTKIPATSMVNFDIQAESGRLMEQFQILAKLDQRALRPHAAQPVESEKHRYPDITPVDRRRPFLQTPGKKTSSNYINACLVTSYRKKDAFIATQSPLPNTVEDFWRLICDWKCPLIVMLNQLDPMDKTCCKYWPESSFSHFGHLTVKLKDEQNVGLYVHRQFYLTNSLNHQESRVVHQMQLNTWDDSTQHNVTTLIREMEKLQEKYSMVAPTVVHCINGVGRTGVFLTIKCELERIRTEGSVDIFNTVRQLRRSNHSMVYTEGDYYFCYEVLKSEFSESHYANI